MAWYVVQIDLYWAFNTEFLKVNAIYIFVWTFTNHDSLLVYLDVKSEKIPNFIIQTPGLKKITSVVNISIKKKYDLDDLNDKWQ